MQDRYKYVYLTIYGYRFSEIVKNDCKIKYRGIQEKGSGDVVSAVCYIIYTTYIHHNFPVGNVPGQ